MSDTKPPKVHAPFMLTAEVIDRSDSLDHRDEGKYALLVAGCYHIFKTRQEATACRNKINAP